jgi:hypothetical protein
MTNPAFRLADGVAATAMQVGSTLRSARIFHPDGIASRVRVTIRPTAEDADASELGVGLLDRPGSYEGVVRFSRGASLPEPLPDVLGLAVRICDAHGPGGHQDILVGSSLELPVGRQLLLPTIGFRGTTLSSVLPYRLGSDTSIGRGTFWLGARVSDPSGAPLVRLSTLRAAIDADEVSLTLRYASRFGAWRTFADVDIGEPLSDEESDALTFNVDDNTGGGIEPSGFFQALRRHAYAASQAARPS